MFFIAPRHMKEDLLPVERLILFRVVYALVPRENGDNGGFASHSPGSSLLRCVKCGGVPQ